MEEPSGLSVAIDLGGTKISAGLVDTAGQLTHETYLTHAADQHPASAGVDPVLERLLRVARTLMAAAAAQGRRVRGVGVGAPGVTRADGTIVSAAPLGWRDMPLRALLEEALGIQVQDDNDVNAIAIGEYRFGAGRGARSLFVLAVGTGIGGAIVIDGKLHRGHRDAGGEVGAIVPGREFLNHRGAEWGALESVASGTGIAARARAAADASQSAVPHDAEALFRAAAAGDPVACELFGETVDYLSVAVANIQAVLDPERIVLAGGVGRAADQLIPAITRRLAGALPFPPNLVASGLGYRAGVLGAAALVD